MLYLLLGYGGDVDTITLNVGVFGDWDISFNYYSEEDHIEIVDIDVGSGFIKAISIEDLGVIMTGAIYQKVQEHIDEVKSDQEFEAAKSQAEWKEML